SFCFQRTRRHPGLASFPTRRSSDLAEQRAQAVGQRVEELEDVALRCRDVAGVPRQHVDDDHREGEAHPIACPALVRLLRGGTEGDRKSTRLNSSHLGISYAVFCLKK